MRKEARIATVLDQENEISAGSFHKIYDTQYQQFCVESDVLFTQGGTLSDNKIYYTYGCPKIGYPLAILVFDLEKKVLCAQIGNLDEAFHGEEIECCAFYEGRLLCNTCDGSIFEIKGSMK